MQVEEFQQRKQQEMQALSSQLQHLQSSISSTQQLMSDALSSQAGAAGQALSAAQASHAASADEMGQALQTAGKAVAGALDSLRGSLEAQSTQLLAFSQQQEEATAAAQHAAAAGLARAKEGMLAVGASVQQLNGMAQGTTEALSNKLAAFAADFETSMEEKQQVLVEQLGSLLAGFVQDRQQAVAAAVAEVKQQLVDGQQELSSAAAGASAAVDGCVSRLAVSSKQKLVHLCCSFNAATCACFASCGWMSMPRGLLRIKSTLCAKICSALSAMAASLQLSQLQRTLTPALFVCAL
jgi:hypothetical protein